MTTEAPSHGGSIASKTGILISSDSHVIEPHDLWTKALGGRFGNRAPAFEPLKKGEGSTSTPVVRIRMLASRRWLRTA